MSHANSLTWWFAQANYEQRVPTPGDLKLERMRLLLRRLGEPHRRLRILHVAGSKGKGSTSALLATILDRGGYRVGLFTSPHLTSLEERYQVGGKPITPNELTLLAGEIREVVQASPLFETTAPTFFEIATAIGFLHFLRRRCDLVVLEVGLGGRLDSTNVCRPLLAVITSISYDHMHLLGSTLAQIAWEKAGIVKAGVPTISGATHPEAGEVIERVCAQRGSRLLQVGRDIHYRYTPGQVRPGAYLPPRVEVATPTRTWPSLALNLLGDHQGANAALALASVEELRRQGLHVSDEAVKRGLAEVVWPARLEVVAQRPLVLVDCAHNVASMEALVHTMEASFPAGRRWLVFAGSTDKDIPGMFQVLTRAFDGVVLTRFTANSRSVPPEQLAGIWSNLSEKPCEVSSTPREALARVLASAGPDDLVCITGSVFLAGEVRPLLLGTGGGTFSLANLLSPR